MTTKTVPAKPARQRAVPVKPPKPPGRLALAWRRRRAQAALTVLPYACALAVAAAAALALHKPGPLWAAGGGVAAVAARIAWEEHGWHRAGGKAAARKRRKYQGTATGREIRRKLSPAAAAAKTRVICPDLDPAYAPVVIGRSVKPSGVIAGHRADSYLVLAPPQVMKTGLISCWAADAPGALLATSSRGDLYRHTAASRMALGEVLVLNADGLQGLPADFAWSPVDGCANPQTAIRRAGDLMHASPRDTTGKDAWHEDRGAKLLRYMLHAAAVAGASMHEVAAWVEDPLSAEPRSALESPAAYPGWAGKLAALVESADDRLGELAGSASAALGWMDDPVMAASACPAPGSGFRAREFVAGAGSVYLIGADRPHGSLAPYFAALTAEVFHAARTEAEDSGGRLPIPLTLALDEAATICPVPLHQWTSVAAGHNITVIAGIQSPSQLPARWGENDAKTIRNNFTFKIIGEGFTDPEDLEALSFICGEQDTWHHVRNPDGGKTRQPEKQRVFPPERIRLLGSWHALALRRDTRPVEVVVTPVWERPGYERAVTGAGAFPAPERPAIEGPRREAIPMPPVPVPVLAGPAAVPDPVPSAPEEVPWPVTTSG